MLEIVLQVLSNATPWIPPLRMAPSSAEVPMLPAMKGCTESSG